MGGKRRVVRGWEFNTFWDFQIGFFPDLAIRRGRFYLFPLPFFGITIERAP